MGYDMLLSMYLNHCRIAIHSFWCLNSMICLLASFLTSRSALFNIVQNMSFVRWYAMCLCEEMTKNKLVDEIYSSKNAEFNLYSCWDAEPFFSFVLFKMRKGTRKKIVKKRDKPAPWQTIHDSDPFVVSNANATTSWDWTVCVGESSKLD